MTDQEMLWEYGGDILRSPTMAREREIPQHGSTTCFDHSVAVALCSIRLARKWGWDVDWRSLVRGALLHDYFLYNWREHNDDHRLHGFYHARRAMENAERDFGLNHTGGVGLCADIPREKIPHTAEPQMMPAAFWRHCREHL